MNVWHGFRALLVVVLFLSVVYAALHVVTRLSDFTVGIVFIIMVVIAIFLFGAYHT
jgi:hypothetical protein